MSEYLLRKNLMRDKATPKCYDIGVSMDMLSWAQMSQVFITEKGALCGILAEEGQKSILIDELQSCYVQIITTVPTQSSRRKLGKLRQEVESYGHEQPPVLFIRSDNNDKLYLEISSRSQFAILFSALLAWQNLKPYGLSKKWFAENKAHNARYAGAASHELLVCRFKVYGPVPGKSRIVNLVNGPHAPGSFEESVVSVSAGSTPNLSSDCNVSEGWFFAMGVLKSNGMLNFITELDGTLLYTINVNVLFSSEIREVHHSLCNSPNTLFIGHIKELRLNNVMKNTSSVTAETLSQSFLSKDGRVVPHNSRILIEFPLHIDLEDWFVGLNYFCRREYIGVLSENSVYLPHSSTRVVDVEGTIDPDKTVLINDDSDISSSGADLISHNGTASLASFTREHLQVSKKVTLDLIEAKFDNLPSDDCAGTKIYAEVILWGYPWARTSMVSHTQNPFWKEKFSTDLPVSTQVLRIDIKKCTHEIGYGVSDKVLGTVYITPDILTQKLRTISTMMIEPDSGDRIKVSDSSPISLNLAAAAIAAPQNNNIVRLSIYDDGNIPIGKLLLTVDLREYFILPPAEFRNLEAMLLHCPMKQLIEYCNNTVGTSDIEHVSYILLDIYQSLGAEEDWFKSLIDAELIAVDKITRKNYSLKKSNSAQTTNVFNTMFRGSSIFTKSLERYNFRIGQEYLEKVFGNFFEKITSEKKDCEIDPRYVKLQERAKRNGFSSSDAESADFDMDSDVDSHDLNEEVRLDKLVNERLEANFTNLYAYTEEIWSKIFFTSNDLPQQIKTQLKNFRNKIDLVCDPADRTTSLNCMSAFIFLRFFCPAILNPKLFYLTKNHQTGQVQRTLTVIAKILLNLANRQEFSPHKEAHLVKMNGFLKKHEHEVLEYFDKISGRKNDFNEKILNLSHEVKRFDLGLSGNSASSELPTTPYLINKTLRLTELIYLLQLHASTSRSSKLVSSDSTPSLATTISSDHSTNRHNHSQTTKSPSLSIPHDSSIGSGIGDDICLNNERDVYQIGSLEFEKSELLNLAENDETEGFIKSLCRNNEDIFSFIDSNTTLKDLQKESANLKKKINDLARRLQQPESCSHLKSNGALWGAFVDNVLSRACFNFQKNCIDYYEPNFQDVKPPHHKYPIDNALAILKLRFSSETKAAQTEPAASLSLATTVRRNSKNPFKRWLRKE